MFQTSSPSLFPRSAFARPYHALGSLKQDDSSCRLLSPAHDDPLPARPPSRCGPSLVAILSDSECSSGGDASAFGAGPDASASYASVSYGTRRCLLRQGLTIAADAVSDWYDTADARGQIASFGRRLSRSQNLLPADCLRYKSLGALATPLLMLAPAPPRTPREPQGHAEPVLRR